MTIHGKWHGHGRLVSSIALALGCATASLAGVSVTDVAVAPGSGGGIALSYRLNQAATSVSIQIAGGSTVTGTTTKGLNTVQLPSSANGKTATITAAAPAPDGPGGAAVLVPVTSPDNRATPASTNLVAVDVNRRIGSKYLGHIYLPTGFSQAGQKFLWVYAPDGTLVQTKDLSGFATSGSYPYGLAVAHADTQDRIVVHNRSLGEDYILAPDLSRLATQIGISTLVPGLAVTPGSGNADQPWNLWHAGNKTKDVRRYTSDLTTNAGIATVSTSLAAETLSTGENSHDIAVDDTNQFLFKVQVTDGGVGPLDTGGVNKWTSGDNGSTWTEDTTWHDTFMTDITTELTNALSALTTNGLVGGGISLANGFNAASPASSSVWVAVSGGSGATMWNRIYRVNAASGHIEQTVDIQQFVTPDGGIAFAGKAVHFLEADAFGNLVVGVQAGSAMDGRYTRYFAVIAPTAATNTATINNVDLTLPLSATGTVNKASAANTGTVQVTYTINASDNAGIVADNVQVTGDLTAIGGTAGMALTRGTVSADGKTAPYTLTFTVPTTVDLTNSGTFDIPFTVTATSNATGIVTRVSQAIYNAYTPAWTATTTAPVNSSAVTNGSTAYIGDDAGNVYAFDTTTGQPFTNFGGGSVALSGAVKGQLDYFMGRLYVATSTHVYVLNGGTGAVLGSTALSNVSSLAFDPVYPGSFFAAAGNTIVKLNALTAAQEAVTADLGAKVNQVAVIPNNGFVASPAFVVAGTEGDETGLNGKIIAVSVNDLSPVNGTDPVLATDTLGAVRSKAASSNDGSTSFFTIGGASGEWYFNADTVALVDTWVADSGGGANIGGNPYLSRSPVDANPTVPLDVTGTDANGKENARLAFATAGSASEGGGINVLNASVGERSSYGGFPVALTPAGSGFAAGSGLLGVNTTDDRALYIGSDAVDQRFFGLETKPDDISYAATAAKKHIFNPSDTAAFPGAVAGAFNSAPALSLNKVVVGSAAMRVYGFPSLTATRPGVVSATPANGANGVATTAGVSLVFDQDISAASVDPFNTTVIYDDAGNLVESTATVQADNKTLVIQPNSALTANKVYTVVVLASAGVQPYSATFYTGIPPAVQGDINGDGSFNLNDVKEALRIAAGLKTATAQAVTASGNKVTAGSITIEDAVFLEQVLAGKASF
jgi:hypothetical protein